MTSQNIENFNKTLSIVECRKYHSNFALFMTKCSLHWMMSYAVNTTFREEELYEYSYSNQNEDYQASVIT